MANQKSTSPLDTSMAKLAAARSRAAIGGEFAPDYKEIKGVRFYYQTVAHAWVLPYLSEMDAISGGIVVLYALAHDADAVRNKVLPEIWDGSIVRKATEFFIEKGLSPADLDGLDVALLQHPYASGQEKPEDDSAGEP